MNKGNLIEIVTEKAQLLPSKELEQVIKLVFEEMSVALQKGKRIELKGFGVFEVRHYKPRIDLVPSSVDITEVKKRRLPFFKVGQELKKRVRYGGADEKSPPNLSLS